jgi:GAF domain-containing protein
MLRETLLVHTLVELADTLVEDFDVIEVLTVLSARCVEALDVAAAGVMLATPKGELQVVASSSEGMRILELFEVQTDEGPCVDCYRSGQPVADLVISIENDYWPQFTVRAIAEGFRSVFALPMRLRGRTIGALNLFRTESGALDEADLLAAQALADVATIAILQHRIAVESQMLNSQLSQALTSRIVIEQAKGKVSEAAGLSMDDAFQRLRRHARAHNLRLAELSLRIADGSLAPTALDPLPPPSTRQQPTRPPPTR